MLLSALLALLCLLAALQPNAARRFAAVCFAGAIMLHDLLLSDLDGFAYFSSAALTDLGVLFVLSRMPRPCGVVVVLARVCLLSAVWNMVGYAIWFAYLPPTAYEVAFIALYSYTAWELLKGGLANDGGFAGSGRGAGATFDSSASRRLFFKSKGSE